MHSLTKPTTSVELLMLYKPEFRGALGISSFERLIRFSSIFFGRWSTLDHLQIIQYNYVDLDNN